ncbi:MAG: hypothetical protein KKB77_08165 [Bacteroidetes bacterium]|nr:hypothetical protein [Bacteroidota bacterium]
MHQYSSTHDLNPVFYVSLSALCVVCALLLHLALIALKLDELWWIEFPSVLGFYGIFWRWFDKKGWTVLILRKLFHITTPDLSGSWSVHADTLIENRSHTVRAEATIKQSWSKLKIFIDWENSTSTSVSASLHEVSPGEFELIYQYVNTPKALAPSTMNMHRGTAWLNLSNNDSQMEGEYYSGRGRNKFGQLTLRKQVSQQ